MSTPEVFNLFLIVSALHGFAFSLILFYSKNGKEKSMLYLNLFILSISLNNLQSWALENNLFQHKFLLDYIQIPWHLLLMPFCYTFLIHYLNIEKKSVNLLKIFIPVFILMVLAQISFVLYTKGSLSHEDHDYLYEKYTSFEEIVSFLSSIGTFFYSYYILIYKKEKLFSKITSYDNLKWIYTFFKLSLLGYVLWVTALIVKINLNFTGFLFSYYPLRIYTTVLIYWLGYQGLRQLRILKERKKIRESLLVHNFQTITADFKDNESTSINGIDKEKHREQFKEIDSFIRDNKMYLKNKYTLQNLAEDTKLSTSTLSLIINNVADKSFVDYLNEMRVEQAKKLLLDPDYIDYTITSIGLESGFNSKSTFYTVFKKHAGLTPVSFKSSSNHF
ncbi:hypothetical protein WH52_07595 [Tenacibaculum holothuriorum]|uniref:HTH araC/xylS-type domain-containing protein n=1 Tax=Tenacibaculum holothuriorum TaxID=1635173 RepID=A0A1Y2PDM4_9FLAO|nr:helix-turn-helix domain-containing protein [Tenacibaculum holothuriorum]OSY87897.1 hypothetical protein WH52_07595 [Tenacibaculum holothuriorum]